MDKDYRKILGQVAYEAYCGATHWKSLVSGATLLPWDQLKPEIQAAWKVAAHAVRDTIREGIDDLE